MGAMMATDESTGVGGGIAIGDASDVKGGSKGSSTLDVFEEAIDTGDHYADMERKNPEPPPVPVCGALGGCRGWTSGFSEGRGSTPTPDSLLHLLLPHSHQ